MTFFSSKGVLLFLVIAARIQEATAQKTQGNDRYGADCSFPIHHWRFKIEPKCEDAAMGANRVQYYKYFIQSCHAHFGIRCLEVERERLELSRRQPQSMKNYTAIGFEKIRAPDALFQLIREHWERNKDNNLDAYVEKWDKGSTYVNHWEQNTTYYSVSDSELGGSRELEAAIYEQARPIIEQWTGVELRPTSLYGIRVYRENAVLSPHVDRNPLISSAIINVAQDPNMKEDWPLEVYGKKIQLEHTL
jgi:prolyl 4-hydroxylase